MARRIGTPGDDYLEATGSSGDALDGLGGNDRIVGGPGGDLLSGGAGDDYLSDTLGGDDRLLGGFGNDLLQVFRPRGSTDGALVLDGGAGDDRLEARYDSIEGFELFSSAQLYGGGGRDFIITDNVNGRADGGAGDDFIFFRYGDAVLEGGAGDDYLYYLGSRSTSGVLDGGTGDDRIEAVTFDAGASIVGGDGADDIYMGMFGGVFLGEIDAGVGDDTVLARAFSEGISLAVRTGAGNDDIASDGYAISVDAGAGDDSIAVDGRRVLIDAGSGRDVVTVLNTEGEYRVTLGGAPDRLVLAGPSTAAGDPRVTVTDFRTGNSGDTLDISVLLDALGWTAAAGDPFAAGYVRLVQRGSDAVLQAHGADWADQALLLSVSAASFVARNLDFAPDSPVL